MQMHVQAQSQRITRKINYDTQSFSTTQIFNNSNLNNPKQSNAKLPIQAMRPIKTEPKTDADGAAMNKNNNPPLMKPFKKIKTEVKQEPEEDGAPAKKTTNTKLTIKTEVQTGVAGNSQPKTMPDPQLLPNKNDNMKNNTQPVRGRIIDNQWAPRQQDQQQEDLREVRNRHELAPIVLARSQLIRLADKSDRFGDIVKNCYVRLLTKTDKLQFFTVYRIIGTIDTYTPIGKSKFAKRIKVDNQRILESVDEQPLKQEEFDAWLANAKQKNQTLPTVQWVKQRAAEISKALNQAARLSPITEPEQLAQAFLDRAQLIMLLKTEDGRKLAEGCFLRMVLNRQRFGSVKYGIAQIVGVTEASEGYNARITVGDHGEEHRVYHNLTLRHISTAFTDINLQSVSGSPFEIAEFEEWAYGYADQHLSLPTVNFIEDKGRALAEHMPQKMPIKRELKAEPSRNDEKDDAGPSAKKMRR